MAKKGMRSKPGKKHRIIFITHSLNRVWRNLLFADVVIWIVWFWAPYSGSPYFMPPYDQYLFYAGTILFGLMVLAFLFRKSGYVQAKTNHVLLRVPIFRLRIPFDYIENVRMASFREIYKGVNLNWAARRFLKPYFRETVATLPLKQFPLAPGLLRIFIPSYLFLPKDTGFLLLIKDYIGFNTEVDSRINVFRGQQGPATDQTEAFPKDEYDGYFNLFDD
jgi:hypothetical protein